MLVREVITDAKTGETTERWVDVPDVLTVEQAQAADLVARAEQERTDRNARLMACDWTVLPDAPLDAIQRASWTVYRQALRDVTDQAGFPDAVKWPIPPADTGRAQIPQDS